MLAASCQGAPLAATARKTTASTSELRMITALRLYLSAQTPHSGINGSPATKNKEKSRPSTWPMSASDIPTSDRRVGMKA